MSWWRIQIFDSNNNQVDETFTDQGSMKKVVEDMAEKEPDKNYICTPVHDAPVPDPYTPPPLE